MTIQREAAACRQLAARAREHVRQEDLDSRWKNNAAWHLPKTSSPLRAVAI